MNPFPQIWYSQQYCSRGSHRWLSWPVWMFVQGPRKVLSRGSAVVTYDSHRQGLFFWLFHCFQRLPLPSDFEPLPIVGEEKILNRRLEKFFFSDISVLKASFMWRPSRTCGKYWAWEWNFSRNSLKSFLNFGKHFSAWKTRGVSPRSSSWQQRWWSNGTE